MGLPMIQVFMIMARQMSKPVADMVMRYGKNHPLFRNKVLIPVGRGLVHLSTRLRLKNLGLGKPATIAQVSESTALEQASEFVQQVVIFGYTVGVLYAYTTYSNMNQVPNASREDMKKLQMDLNRQIFDLNARVEQLNAELRQLAEQRPQQQSSWSWNPWRLLVGDDSPAASRQSLPAPARRMSEPTPTGRMSEPTPTISRQEAVQLIARMASSSLLDATTATPRSGSASDFQAISTITDGD